ncbi:hypothetical protein [Raoultella ornithinolytica]|uniref:hypothetical protein n=1 Tax=Raoultella ornithinolytica TaxID=54291 RepID=UPI0021AF1D23|nr:hypothetical protein [Raoultella ornithinolytica]MCT4737221.1 hypothetical protein [Raoultella ornithinolytica]
MTDKARKDRHIAEDADHRPQHHGGENIWRGLLFWGLLSAAVATVLALLWHLPVPGVSG